MVTSLSMWVRRISSWRNLALFVGLTLLMALAVFPWLRGQRAEEGGVTEILDIQWSYTSEEVYALFESLGEGGRRLYAIGEVTVDLIFPIVYTLSLAMWITLTFGRAFAPNSLLQRLHLFPFGLMAFDFLENSGIVILLLVYPAELRGLAKLVGLFTTTKWTLAVICLGLGVIGSLAVAAKKIGRRA